MILISLSLYLAEYVYILISYVFCTIHKLMHILRSKLRVKLFTGLSLNKSIKPKQKNMKRVNLINDSKLNFDVEVYGNSKNPLLFQNESLREVSDLSPGLSGRESCGIWKEEGSLQKVQVASSLDLGLGWRIGYPFLAQKSLRI